ncbi:glycosyl transferase [Capsulimonas corticalis]|uniref:Glycosyl transferase n=1 Tax=Capsulimonas corticalis TaxID=2219043 RepID=A0A9N7L3J7_9BACT|nr:glycosyl transferase [Capsulimonas corticalis]
MCDVTISIVSYNTSGPLRDCLQTLQDRRDEGEVTMEVVVADNSSTDDSVAMVRREFPWVRVVETGGNIGYGRANNAGQENARGRYAFILNSDTEVLPGALQTMRDFMDANPKVGGVGAQLILVDGSTQASCARDPSLKAVWWEQTYLDKLFPKNTVTGNYLMTDWDYGTRREVEQVCGACLFVRREAYTQIGGFDPAFFMYFEDTDFCIRLRRAGWPIWFIPEARIRHLLGASSGNWRSRARMIVSYNRSRYYYFTRYEGRLRGLAIKAMCILGATMRSVAWHAIALVKPSARDQARLFRKVWIDTVRMKPVGDAGE